MDGIHGASSCSQAKLDNHRRLLAVVVAGVAVCAVLFGRNAVANLPVRSITFEPVKLDVRGPMPTSYQALCCAGPMPANERWERLALGPFVVNYHARSKLPFLYEGDLVDPSPRFLGNLDLVGPLYVATGRAGGGHFVTDDDLQHLCLRQDPGTKVHAVTIKDDGLRGLPNAEKFVAAFRRIDQVTPGVVRFLEELPWYLLAGVVLVALLLVAHAIRQLRRVSRMSLDGSSSLAPAAASWEIRALLRRAAVAGPVALGLAILCAWLSRQLRSPDPTGTEAKYTCVHGHTQLVLRGP